MKRLIVCCDGTWQDLESSYPSNVVKLTQGIKQTADDGTEQIVFYDAGIGTETQKLSGGAAGVGIDRNIQDGYRFLCLNYVPGDEIYMFGFSRGAYTVRSLAGMIHCSGLANRPNVTDAAEAYELYRNRDINPADNQAVEYRKIHGDRVPITLIGCFDTVGSLGIPVLPLFKMFKPWLSRRYAFYDTTLNRDVQNAIHAVAIDEIREVFDVTLMSTNIHAKNQRLLQKWFPGNHGCVGGGTETTRGLSDAALKWMIDSIGDLGLGLEFNVDAIPTGIQTSCQCSFDNNPGFFKLAGIKLREVGDSLDDLHESTINRVKDIGDYRPKNIEKFIDKIIK
ncbi:DUF2235 domain-containing protein [Crocosphaera sp.]|uniref:DUF2235 domain-containing protein n=1 Tax=Crocosphaera sp. TaxID=2729996 RepID=UPI00262D197B|nr:DUF2235 domain-containing protein [Crocosphaera sp.]MDJ0581375.1 DUF2235 domain-containing protein [Crocosphaera sp.]